VASIGFTWCEDGRGTSVIDLPVQTMLVETDRNFVTTWRNFAREYKCSEEPCPRTNKSGQDPNYQRMALANSANTEAKDTKYNKSVISNLPHSMLVVQKAGSNDCQNAN